MEDNYSSQDVWKWWEPDELAKNKPGVNWTFLEHNGPVFSSYIKILEDIKFLFDDKPMSLSEEAEEVASFYAKMLNSDYTKKEKFNENFFADWRKVMTEDEKEKIKEFSEFSKCNFKNMHEYFLEQTKEAKKQEKSIEEKYGFCTMDGHKQRTANFKIESGLFTGRGDNPKMGKVKRVLPEDVTINCSQDSKFPAAPHGYEWKKVIHKPEVVWLASWKCRIGNPQEESKETTYMNFHPSSKVRGLPDFEKYEMARRLHECIGRIRDNYTKDWESENDKIKQSAVALYFIDTLALRVGNKKGKDEPETTGCCTLQVKHITLHGQKDDKQHVIHLKFLGKSSVWYDREVSVEELVYRNLKKFVNGKTPEEDLFDLVSAEQMNDYLKSQMTGLTAKAFRICNASCTLQERLDKYDKDKDSPKEFYKYANLQVAMLCNHQRSQPKNRDVQIKKVQGKIVEKRKSISAAEKDDGMKKSEVYKKDKIELETLTNQIKNLELQGNKNYKLDSSKEDYLDPRITISWCKKFGIDIEKIFSESQRNRFRWAIDSTVSDYRF